MPTARRPTALPILGPEPTICVASCLIAIMEWSGVEWSGVEWVSRPRDKDLSLFYLYIASLYLWMCNYTTTANMYSISTYLHHCL